jgi:hypothetical protein
MRITTDQKIAGFSAMRIRQLMRHAVDGSITLWHVCRILGCSAVATRVLKRLQKDGFVESARGAWSCGFSSKSITRSPLKPITHSPRKAISVLL